jgi:hypothetical protein
VSKGPTRYLVGLFDGAATPHCDGDLVKFADVEEALQDKDRLEWLLPVLAGRPVDPVAEARTRALAAGVQVGLAGRHLVDWAREGCP